jgi:rhamnogalacturonyl hydrolase YesR
MLEAMPMHGEMSDAFFMAGPILARIGRLTGEGRYHDMVARHVRFMQGLVLRPDGLYRHSPLTEAAWGRGNAFPALGLALTLSDVPASHAAFPDLLDGFRAHLATLLQFQDADGMWHEVIDHPGSYAELSATAMIGTAMLRGIRNGWLQADTYQPRVEAAWRAVLARTGPDGVLIDVCESTNKQPSLEDYLNRAAILGQDVRGGGMMLLFATEMAGMQ